MPAGAFASNFPTSIVSQRALGAYTNAEATQLVASVALTDTTFFFTQTSNLAVNMFLATRGLGGYEIVQIISLDQGAQSAVVVRAIDGTVAVAHSQGQSFYPTLPAIAVGQAFSEIFAMETTLGIGFSPANFLRLDGTNALTGGLNLKGGTAFTDTITGTPTSAHTFLLPDFAGTFILDAGAQSIAGAKTFVGGVTVTTTGLTITDQNIILASATGTKIGTATTQKISFFNAAPIVQPAQTLSAIADGTGGTPTTTFAAIAAGTSYAQSDIVAIRDALAEIALLLNAYRTTIRSLGLNA